MWLLFACPQHHWWQHLSRLLVIGPWLPRSKWANLISLSIWTFLAQGVCVYKQPVMFLILAFLWCGGTLKCQWAVNEQMRQLIRWRQERSHGGISFPWWCMATERQCLLHFLMCLVVCRGLHVMLVYSIVTTPHYTTLLASLRQSLLIVVHLLHLNLSLHIHSAHPQTYLHIFGHSVLFCLFLFTLATSSLPHARSSHLQLPNLVARLAPWSIDLRQSGLPSVYFDSFISALDRQKETAVFSNTSPSIAFYRRLTLAIYKLKFWSPFN